MPTSSPIQVTVLGGVKKVAIVKNDRPTPTEIALSTVVNKPKAEGNLGDVQFNDGVFLGADPSLHYDKNTNVLTIKSGQILLSNSNIIVSGQSPNTNLFTILNQERELLKVDTQNNQILFAPNALDSGVYFGFGTDDPQERVHIDGNLKIDGDVIINGNSLEDRINFNFSQVSLESGVATSLVSFDPPLDYTPKVFVNIGYSGAGAGYIYGSAVSNVTVSGFTVSFSDKIADNDYYLEVFTSPKILV